MSQRSNIQQIAQVVYETLSANREHDDDGKLIMYRPLRTAVVPSSSDIYGGRKDAAFHCYKLRARGTLRILDIETSEGAGTYTQGDGTYTQDKLEVGRSDLFLQYSGAKVILLDSIDPQVNNLINQIIAFFPLPVIGMGYCSSTNLEIRYEPTADGGFTVNTRVNGTTYASYLDFLELWRVDDPAAAVESLRGRTVASVAFNYDGLARVEPGITYVTNTVPNDNHTFWLFFDFDAFDLYDVLELPSGNQNAATTITVQVPPEAIKVSVEIPEIRLSSDATASCCPNGLVLMLAGLIMIVWAERDEDSYSRLWREIAAYGMIALGASIFL